MNDKVKARQRFRICPTTMRLMTCIMLCKVLEMLIQKHGFNGAEKGWCRACKESEQTRRRPRGTVP